MVERKTGALLLLRPLGIEDEDGPFLGKFIDGLTRDDPREVILTELGRAFAELFRFSRDCNLPPHNYTVLFISDGEDVAFDYWEVAPYIQKALAAIHQAKQFDA